MNHFRELRIKNGFSSQAELAKVLYVNQTAVSQWERGVTIPSPSILLKLSKMYRVSTDYLLGAEGSSPCVESSQEASTPIKEASDESIKFALFGKTEIDDDVYESVKQFAKFAADQKRGKKKDD